ncbi:MAG: DUF433 domain-containing protein [Planctomycetota bacterium]|nr:DUF433 domain-containing protein [Planctomycetota bacterium]
MTAKIIDRGRGPEIEGTRITVYDVVDDWQKGWHHDQIAGLFRLPPDDVQEAIRYIEQHHDEVLRDNRAIVDRHRNHKYSPAVKEKPRRRCSVARFGQGISQRSAPHSTRDGLSWPTHFENRHLRD